MPVKVCHIASIDITVKFLLLPQLKSLVKEGYYVHVVYSKGTLTKEIEQEGIKVKAIEIKRKLFSPISDIVALIKLYFYFRKEKFDIVHTHAPKPGLLGQLAAKAAGVPIIINTIHGLYFTEDSSSFRKNVFTFIEKISAQCSTLIFSQNREDIQTMVDKKIAPADKIVYLGNGIDLARFNPQKFSQDFIKNKKRELGLPEDARIIGIVGRLVKEKGYLEMFEAMKEIIQRYPNAILLSVGPDDLVKKDKLSKEIIKEYGIENNIVFLGQREDIEEIFPLMDIFVLPSHREGFPRSVIEAMAMERPIVVTDIRGCREEIDNGINGIIIPVKNSKELAKAVVTLLDDKNKADELAKHAKMKAEREFDETIIFSRILKEYQYLIGKKL